MKAILVMDMPSSCIDCRFCREIDEGTNACCEIMDEPGDSELCRMIDVIYPQDKPYWCPLRPVPKKRQTLDNFWEMCANIVRNACIDEILGIRSENEK